MAILPFVLLFILICIGFPIGFALILSALAFTFFLDLAPISFIPGLLYHSVQSFVLIAIPFFILAAELLSSGALIDRLFRVADAFVGRMRGGMGVVAVIATGIFAGIQGSSAADAAAIGKVGTEGMVRQGYAPGFSASLIAASSATAILIPPSIAMLIYASLTNVSVGRLFFAGIVPGVLSLLFFIIYIIVRARRQGWKAVTRATVVNRREKWLALKDSVWILLLPIFILYGFDTGLFTATEIGTVTVVYSAILAVFVYKTLAMRDIWGVVKRCAVTNIKIFVIIAGAILFSKVLTFMQVPQIVLGFIQQHDISGLTFLFIISGCLFILGMFMEAVSLNVMTTPIVYPMLLKLGIDPVHYGVVLVLNIEIAMITPPVGLNLFVLSGVTNVRLTELYRRIWPFVLLLLFVLLICILAPGLSLALPDMLLPNS